MCMPVYVRVYVHVYVRVYVHTHVHVCSVHLHIVHSTIFAWHPAGK